MGDFIGIEGVTHHHACDCREEIFRKLEEDNKKLVQWVADLQSGLYINCVYCGHRYPPGTPDVRDNILYEHIKICPKHPLAHALAEIERLSEVEDKLDALEAAGVDNWEGYDDAMDILRSKEDDE